MKSSDTTLLRLIALFKFVKAALLIAVGIGAFKLLHSDLTVTLDHWITKLGLDPGNRWIERAFEHADTITPDKMKVVGAVSLLYAGLFLTEGTGLWLARRWGEWVTVIITSSLVPVEVYELIHHPNLLKVGVLLINVAVVIYLIFRIRAEKSAPS
jgi:uncharacterized membrane protein (DUF2068 family)